MHRASIRPENLVVAALVVVGVSILGGLAFFLPGTVRDDPAGTGSALRSALVVIVTGGVVAGLLMLWARSIRRRERPQWLETQGWHSGQVDQIRRGHPGLDDRDSGKTGG